MIRKYMQPDWALEDQFCSQRDLFSFGGFHVSGWEGRRSDNDGR